MHAALVPNPEGLCAYNPATWACFWWGLEVAVPRPSVLVSLPAASRQSKPLLSLEALWPEAWILTCGPGQVSCCPKCEEEAGFTLGGCMPRLVPSPHPCRPARSMRSTPASCR